MSISYPRIDTTGGQDDASDASLVARARAGDRAAVDALVDRHIGTVRAVCRSRLRSPHDVNDAIQETFLRALPRLGEVRDADRVAAWLRAIAVRVCADHHRASVRTISQPAPGVEHADLGRGPEESALGSDAARTLHRRLASLSERDARALWLRDAHGVGVNEVARDLGVTEGSARVLLTRARHRLRATYQGVLGVGAVAWLKLRQRLDDLLGPGGIGEGRAAAVAAVAQAGIAAAIVLTIVPTPDGDAPAAAPQPEPTTVEASVTTPTPDAPPVALASPLASPTPQARPSTTVAPTEPEPTTVPEVRAGPVTVTEEKPDEEPAAAVEAGEQGEIAEALVYAGNLVTGGGDDDQAEASGQSGTSDDGADGDQAEDEDDGEEDVRIGRDLVRRLVGGVQP